MMTLIRMAMTHPYRLQWWQWGQILGLIIPVLFFVTGIRHPLLWALAAHIFTDFTAQSDETVVAKARGDWRVLVCHAFISGGYAGLIIGGLPGLAISAIIHFWIDMKNKFGLNGFVGPFFDQVAHIITLVILWWLLQSLRFI